MRRVQNLWSGRQRIGLDYGGSERTTRRAVAQVKRDWRAGRQVHRPWVPKPGDNVTLTKRPGLSGYSRGNTHWSVVGRVNLPVREATSPGEARGLSPTLDRPTWRVGPAGSSA